MNEVNKLPDNWASEWSPQITLMLRALIEMYNKHNVWKAVFEINKGKDNQLDYKIRFEPHATGELPVAVESTKKEEVIKPTKNAKKTGKRQHTRAG